MLSSAARTPDTVVCAWRPDVVIAEESMPDPTRPDPMHRLGRLNRTAVFLGSLVIGLAGLFLPGIWGALLLYAIVATLAALLARTWAVSSPPARVARFVILAGLAAIATMKIIN
jgi:hypothetical protein